MRRDCTLAVLLNCKREDMFWDRYTVEPITTDISELEMLGSDVFWTSDKITYRSRTFGEIAPVAFAARHAGSSLKETGRVPIRGLYLPVSIYPWDRLLRPVNAKRRESNLSAFSLFRLSCKDLRRRSRWPRDLCFEIEGR